MLKELKGWAKSTFLRCAGYKYELLDSDQTASLGTVLGNPYGVCVKRIRALHDFGSVKKGELGGFVENYNNLSHQGNSWIYPSAAVIIGGRVTDDAVVGIPTSHEADFCSLIVHTEISGQGSIKGEGRIIHDDIHLTNNKEMNLPPEAALVIEWG